MKVLHVAETVKGGIATYLNMLTLATQQECENIFLVPENQQQYIDADSIGYRYSQRRPKDLLTMFKTFYRVYKEQQPDIVFMHSTFAGLLRLVCIIEPGLKRKIVYCSHGWSFSMNSRKIVLKTYAVVEHLLSKLNRKIVCISKYEREQASIIGIKNSLLTVIYNSIPKDVVIDEAVTLTLAEDEKYLVFVGRKSEQKGYDLLDEIAKYLPNNYKIIVIGDFQSGDFSSQKIITTGWLDGAKVNYILKNAKALICPSRWEGFGFVVIEAFRAGVPVIGSNRGALPELILTPLNGFTFDLDNMPKLEKIFKVLDDDLKWHQLKANVSHSFEDNFSLDKFKFSVLQLYSEIQAGN
ncbi:glycosyltransferase [Shewanella sp.]|uniref:glycosyltransferase n=1 Tax=Shewanella sp. TaxID=50422 RepID=UPI003A97B4AA